MKINTFTFFLIKLILVVVPSVYAQEQCVLSLRAGPRPEALVSQVIPRGQLTAKTEVLNRIFSGVYKIGEHELQPSLYFEIDEGEHSLPVNVGTNINLTPPIWNKKQKDEVIVERTSSKDLKISSKIFSGGYQELRLERNTNRWIGRFPQVMKWPEITAAMRLAGTLMQKKPRANYYEVQVLLPDIDLRILNSLVEMTNEYFLGLLLPMEEFNHYRITEIQKFLPLLDAELRVETTGDAQSRLVLKGNLVNGDKHLLALQYVLTVLSLGKGEQIARLWDTELKGDVQAHKSIPMFSGWMQGFSPSQAQPVPGNFVFTPEMLPPRYRYLKPSSLATVQTRLERLFGAHWPLWMGENSPFNDAKVLDQLVNELKQGWFSRIMGGPKKVFDIRESLTDVLLQEPADQQKLLEVLQETETASLAVMLDKSERKFFDRFSQKGFYFTVDYLTRVKHAEIYSRLEDAKFPLRNAVVGLLEVPEADKKRLTKKLKLLNEYRAEAGFPIFTYAGNQPIYIIENSKKPGRFEIELSSLVDDLFKQNFIMASAFIRGVKSKFTLVRIDGSYYLQSKKDQTIRFPLRQTAGKLEMNSMSCAQWTFFVARTLFPERSFPSFSSPEELARLLLQGAIPGMTFVERW